MVSSRPTDPPNFSLLSTFGFKVRTGTNLFAYLLIAVVFLKVVNLQVEELNNEQESGAKAELKTVELSFQTSDQLMLST